jgi:hypothetical protein
MTQGDGGGSEQVDCENYPQYCNGETPKPIDPCGGPNPSVVCANNQIPKNTCNENRSAYTCVGVTTEPASVFPSEIQIQSGVIDDDYTDFGPDNPPTVNGQTFTPAFGGAGLKIASVLDLLMMGITYAHYNSPVYSGITGSYAQGMIPLIHHKESDFNIIPGVEVYNNTGMNLLVTLVTIDGKRKPINSPVIQNGNTGPVTFKSPEIMITTDMSVNIYFKTIQNNGVVFGSGQMTYNGPNYYPVYGPFQP